MIDARRRRGYLDWMRGLAVLVMIEAHVIDSWTRPEARRSWQFMWSIIVGGFGAPLFLFLAGASVALSAGSKCRRSGSAADAARAVMRRGGWVFFLAFVFRVQAWILGLAAPWTLLKVDILNIMGPAIVAAAALWGLLGSSRRRVVGLSAAAVATTLLAPLVWDAAVLDRWPEAFAGYLRPTRGLSNFSLFPWAGFVFAGGALGVLIDDARPGEAERKLNLRLFAAGIALAAAAYAGSWGRSPYAHSDFWGASPAFFLLRTGIMMAATACAYGWESRPRMFGSWSPMQLFGRHSLLIYWIHVEMVYGLISLRIHRGLSLPAVWVALGFFTLFMLGCAAARERYSARRTAAPTPPAPSACPAP